MNTTQSDPENAPSVPARSIWILFIIVILVLAGALVLVVLLTTPPRQSTAELPANHPSVGADQETDLGSVHGDGEASAIAVTLIAPADAKARYDEGKAAFVDLRPGDAYAAGHIADALSLTSQDLDARLQSLPPDGLIVTYTDQANEATSIRGAQILIEIGYPNVVALDGGIQAWQAAGYPVEQGQRLSE